MKAQFRFLYDNTEIANGQFQSNLLPMPLTQTTCDNGYDIRTVQEPLGHRDVSITIYTHILNRGGKEVLSPADSLLR